MTETLEVKLPRFSYSRLDTFASCPMKYKFKYIDGNYEQSDAIHLDIGNLLHKILEIKHRMIIEGKPVDYDYLKSIYTQGVAEDTEKDKGKFIIGLNAIKDKFTEDKFIEINTKSNLSYNDKMVTFLNYLENDDIGDGWKPLAVEVDFNFTYNDRIVLNGFIDRIDINEDGDLRVVDYKSSNKVYESKDLTTPLQMFIYALACENIYGKVPVAYIYDMILLGEKQTACTKGYYNRGIKKLDKILDAIFEAKETGIYKPKATPLCHWCDFSQTNPNTAFYLADLCDYYSLWLPNKKSFAVNKKFETEELEF